MKTARCLQSASVRRRNACRRSEGGIKAELTASKHGCSPSGPALIVFDTGGVATQPSGQEFK